MFKLPGRLRVIQGRRIAGELKLFHHLLRAALFAFEQKRHVDVEFDQLGRFAFIAARRFAKQSLETISRGGVIFLFEWDLSEIELRLTEFWIGFERLLEFSLSLVELFLLEQYLTAQIKRCSLVRIRRIRVVNKFAGRGEITLLK